VDVETTGTNPDRYKIIELGICLFEYERQSGRIYKVLGSWEWFENPGVPIPPEITNITGITDEMVAGRRIFSTLSITGSLIRRWIDAACPRSRWVRMDVEAAPFRTAPAAPDPRFEIEHLGLPAEPEPQQKGRHQQRRGQHNRPSPHRRARDPRSMPGAGAAFGLSKGARQMHSRRSTSGDAR